MAASLVSRVAFWSARTPLIRSSFPLHREGLRLERRLEGDELGLEGGVDRVEDIADGLELGLLVGVHPVDGGREFRDGLLVLEGAPVDGLHHLGEVVDHRHAHRVVDLGRVLLA